METLSYDPSAVRAALVQLAAGLNAAVAAIDSPPKAPVAPTAPQAPQTPPQAPSVPPVAPPGASAETPPDPTIEVQADGTRVYANPASPTSAPILVDGPEGQQGPKWPKWVRTDQGVNIVAKAPLNRMWNTSMYGYVFGHQKGTASFDTSNGDEGDPQMPLRSPMGFPLRWTFDQNKKVIGTATIMMGENAFSNEEEVMKMIAASKAAANAPPDPRWAQMDEAYKARAAAKAEVGLPPAPDRREDGLLTRYASLKDLIADAQARRYVYAIRVDNNGVWPGFGPPTDFKTGPQGQVVR